LAAFIIYLQKCILLKYPIKHQPLTNCLTFTLKVTFLELFSDTASLPLS